MEEIVTIEDRLASIRAEIERQEEELAELQRGVPWALAKFAINALVVVLAAWLVVAFCFALVSA